jgi:hypothetical protein
VRRESVIRNKILKPNYTMNCQNFARIFLAIEATLTKMLVDSLNLWVVEFNYSNLTRKRLIGDPQFLFLISFSILNYFDNLNTDLNGEFSIFLKTVSKKVLKVRIGLAL